MRTNFEPEPVRIDFQYKYIIRGYVETVERIIQVFLNSISVKYSTTPFLKLRIQKIIQDIALTTTEYKDIRGLRVMITYHKNNLWWEFI